jgi:hypothetical protein
MFKFETSFLKSCFLLYIFFLFRWNQKIYVLHFSSNFAISMKFFRNINFVFYFIVFTLIIHLSIVSICSSYAIVLDILTRVFVFDIFDDFRLYIIININHCSNSWRKSIDYVQRWSKLLWHDYRALNRNTQFEKCWKDFSKNEALTQKLNYMRKSVFIYILVSSRRTFYLRQETNVMKIVIMFSTITRISLRMKLIFI